MTMSSVSSEEVLAGRSRRAASASAAGGGESLGDSSPTKPALSLQKDKKADVAVSENFVDFDDTPGSPEEVAEVGAVLDDGAEREFLRADIPSNSESESAAMTAMTASSFPTVGDSFSAYARAVAAIPPLEEGEEERLVAAYRGRGDVAAARRLAMTHLHLVIAVARGYDGYGLDKSDLIQEGNIGLLKAVQKFDPGRGARLATFAGYWIRAEIYNFILRNWRIVKIATTKAQRKLFFHMRRLFEKDGDGNIKSADDIAADLGVRPADVEDMRARVQSTVVSDSDNDRPAMLEARAETADPERILLAKQESAAEKEQVTAALAALDERARTIVESRHLRDKPETLHALAARLNISAERVRQLEKQALQKLRRHLRPD